MGSFKEVVFVSGKGGVGKTSIAASISFLLRKGKVVCDSDVDASNLYLILQSSVLEEEDFSARKKAEINRDACTKCNICLEVCEFGAIGSDYIVDPILCEGCGACYYFCPHSAISFEEKICGRIYKALTKNNDPFFYAELNPGEENSGKLVQKVREKARFEAEKENLGYILIDGPPGIGCPVISSITGTSFVVALAEPNPASFHDLERLIDLTNHFGIKSGLIINKADVNQSYTERLKSFAEERGLFFLGEISYDPAITNAQREGKVIFELKDRSKAKYELEKIYEKFETLLEGI